jgi:uncharacterized protein (UPF0261 family)
MLNSFWKQKRAPGEDNKMKRKGKKTIVVLGSLDTKEEELNYLKQRIAEKGHEAIMVDVSLLNDSSAKSDIGPKHIAKREGIRVEQLSLLSQEEACTIMSRGAANVASELHRSGKLDGIISLGGSMGTSLACAVMRSLPLGVPKLIISTTVGDIRHYVGTKDILFLPAITDFFGLNPVTKRLLDNAAGAMAGMVEVDTGSFPSEKPLIGMSVRGDKNICANKIKSQLEINGFEVICFHAVGQGLVLEEMVREDQIAGVLDLEPAEVSEHLFGGMFDAGPTRLEAAGEKGIPQLIAPGGIEFICFPGKRAIPHRFRKNRRREHNPNVIGVFLNEKDIILVAEVIAEKLNLAKGPTAVIIPKKSFGGRGWTIDTELIPVFTSTLKRELRSEINVVEVDAHINDSSFADSAVDLFLKLMDKSKA